LLLTGYKWNRIRFADAIIRNFPCICIGRRHIFSQSLGQQPFGRSIVAFHYGLDAEKKENPTYIYEEFTFNKSGEINWIEAWDITEDGYQQLQASETWPDVPPGVLNSDPEDPDDGPVKPFNRLSLRIPGLDSTGTFKLNGTAMDEAAKTDKDIEDFQNSANAFYLSVFQTLASNWILDPVEDAIEDLKDDLTDDQNEFLRKFAVKTTAIQKRMGERRRKNSSGLVRARVSSGCHCIIA